MAANMTWRRRTVDGKRGHLSGDERWFCWAAGTEYELEHHISGARVGRFALREIRAAADVVARQQLGGAWDAPDMDCLLMRRALMEVG